MSDAAPPLTTLPPRLRLPSLPHFAAYVLLVLCLATSVQGIDMSLTDLVRGVPNMGRILGEMVPPNLQRLQAMARALLETFQMAFVGSVLGIALSLPLAIAASRTHAPHIVLYHGARLLVSLFRTVPDLIWALMFVNTVGLGPFAGVMAIAVSDAGTLAKLFAEAIENIDGGPVEGVRATGANRLQSLRFAILPQVWPVKLSHMLNYFESNTRSATILGVVGADGIGMQLADRIRANNWDEVAFILIMILVVVSIIDLISKALRLRFINVNMATAAGRRRVALP